MFALKSTVLSLLILAASLAAVGQCIRQASLSDYEYGLFVAAAHGPRSDVTVEFLAAESCEKETHRSLTQLGGNILFLDETVGYFLIRLPKTQILDALDIPGIAYASVPRTYSQENLISLSDRKVVTAAPFTVPFPRVAKTIPSNGPYFAAKEAGLTGFWKLHPQGDGRGVRVAVADRGFDLLHPEMLKSRSSDGEFIPKVADLDVLTTPEKDDSWVQFGPPLQTEHRTIHAAGRTWRVPSDDVYRFGIFDHKISLPRHSSEDLPTESVELSAGVLWNEQRGEVWVDTDGDNDFSNNVALSDYGVDYHIGWFGRVAGEDDNRIPFGVKIDFERKAAYLSIGETHGAYVAGSLAGNKLTGGLFDGAAPNAQLIDVRRGETELEYLLKAFGRTDSEVVNRSGGVAANIPQGEFQRRVLERVIQVYRKPFACYCDLADAANVQDYQSPEMLRRNLQLGPPYLESINSLVWFEDDGLVNTVLAPSASLISQSRYVPFDWTWSDGKRHYAKDAYNPPAPDGYSIGSNPSPTIAVVSGVFADLISEARRTHLRYDHIRLTNAVLTAAKAVPGYAAAEQGFGLIDAAGAWNQLLNMARADDRENPTLTSFVIGIAKSGTRVKVHGFHADLPKAGQSLRGELWLTRVGGYRGPRPYSLVLRANDGTYALLDKKARFARGHAVRVQFQAKVQRGLHVAFLELVDRKANAVMQAIPLSVRAPEVPVVVAPGVDMYTSTIPPRRLRNIYIRLERDVQAADFKMQVPYAGPPSISYRALPGYRWGILDGQFTNPAPPSGPPLNSHHYVGPMQEIELLIANTKPGTQTVSWDNRGTPEYETPYDPPAPDIPIKARLTVKKYAVSFAQDGKFVHVTNKKADIEGRVELYDSKVASFNIRGTGAHASVQLQRMLPGGLSQWRVSVSPMSNAHAVLDAFVLNCTDADRECLVAAQQSFGSKRATLVITDPGQGDWRLVIRSRNRANETVTYEVREAFLTSAATPIQTTNTRYASGTVWSFALPNNNTDAPLYVAFRIARAKGAGSKQSGTLVAMTPLSRDAP